MTETLRPQLEGLEVDYPVMQEGEDIVFTAKAG